MGDIKITLETLYDVLRNEKKREDLQKLDDTFYIDVVMYLREKNAFLDTKRDKDDLFASAEREKLEYEIRSIKRILKEIYEKREKKILDITLNRSRTNSDIIDTSSMLKEEKDFYDKILEIMDQYRSGILFQLFKAELPSLMPRTHYSEPYNSLKATPAIKLTDSRDTTSSVSNFDEADDLDDPSTDTSKSSNKTINISEKHKPDKKEVVPLTRIKITRPMPSFVWKDMKVYGPFDIGEEVDIFPEVADLMIRKGRAEKVES
ncbi:hypothetical protein COY27_05310 [Candidatus Woesearchaeota archaeon CG_4_10_14_0_2_um_filter_33_13]|nr:MAG: hypothetical protein COY27_05310 [Candidatus Woesearchaeota archaeon CG_4_10_14_0_2_um_filter_33_13]